MLLPPILEIYVLWHPDDVEGEPIAQQLFEHFHGTAFSGLVGGAVEVYFRSAGWQVADGPPRPMPFMEPLPNGLPSAAITVVVPLLGTHLTRAAESDASWREYLQALVAASDADPSVGVFGLRLGGNAAAAGTVLGGLFAKQALGMRAATDTAVLCRDLAHSIAGLIEDPMGQRLRVFISHTKRYSIDEGPNEVTELVHLVRDAIASTHLLSFFDEADLQPGVTWEDELIGAAEHSAMLVVRTDSYASREWCQREFLAAKRADMPIVVLQALTR